MGKTGRNSSNSRESGAKRNGDSKTPSYVYILLGVFIVSILTWIFWPNEQIEGISVNEISPTQTEKPESVNITLDVSASMQGYSTSADYTDLISHLKGWIPKYAIWLGDSIFDPKNDIIAQLSGGKVEYTGSSLLNEDIKRLAKRASKDSSVELFITDGILSGSANQINSAPNWNYSHRLELMNDVTAALSSQKDITASVYQLPVQFNGQYYDKENRHDKFNGKRYLYVIALGKAENLAAFKQEMSSLKAKGDLAYSAEWHAIDTKPLSSNFSIGNATRKRSKNNTEYFELNKGDDNPVIRIETKGFVNNVQDSLFYTALADSMVVLMGSKKVVGIKPRYDSTYRDLRAEIPRNMFGKAQTFQVVIKRPATRWIKQSSTNDDSYILTSSSFGSNRHNRTFLLEYLMNGIRTGVNSSDTIYLRDFKIVK